MDDRWVMNMFRFVEESNGLYSTYNQSRRLLYDRWKKPGDITDIPRYGVTAQLDDRFLENSSFLRLKNLTLAYALPQPLLKKMIKKFKLYIMLVAVALSAVSCLDKMPEVGIPFY